MRSAAATTALTAALTTHFDADVAEAITADAEMLVACVRCIADEVNTADDVNHLVGEVASRTPGSTLDWLAATAESPAGWLYQQLTF